MMKSIFLRIVLFLLLTFGFKAYSQYTNIPLGYNFNNFLELEIHQNVNHTSFKPLITNSVNINVDSIIDAKFYSKNKLLRHRFFNKHLLHIKEDDFLINASLISNLTLGYESYDSEKTFTNTRGFLVDGYIGDKLSFQTSFVENQSIFPNYLDSLVRKRGFIVPGQGRGRAYKENGFDYAKSSGFLSIEASKNITIQFGHGKHIIGDGYRSLLFSDNSFNYPYLRIQSNYGKFQYNNLYAEFQNFNSNFSSIEDYDYMGFAKKYMSVNYLSYYLNNKFSIGLYESIIWSTDRSLSNDGFIFDFLNPLIISNTTKYSFNSSDNVIIGLNLKYRLNNKSIAYGQIVIDEFNLNEIKKDNGYWANKYAYQLGYKCFDFLSLPNLILHLERNYVRPYTYSHVDESHYGHYNQELAHPLGANFSENILIISYTKQRIFAQIKHVDLTYGSDFWGDTIPYGGNIFSNLNNRPADYGVQIYNGDETKINFSELKIAYVMNPITNLKFEFTYLRRNQSSNTSIQKTNYYSFSLVSDLFNHYYDF